MLKINRSILIIYIVSLFLIMGQVTASDNDLIEINDSNASHDPMESDKMNIGSESFSSSQVNALSDLSIYENQSDNDEIKDNDQLSDNVNENLQPLEIIREESKDTTGIVMANDNYSCGPASLATVLNNYGLNLSLEEISQHTNTSINGTSMQSMIDAANYYNFSAFGVEMDASNLKENFIVHLNINGCQHWTVIKNITATHVFLADSTEGNINFTLDEFNSYFTQKAIVLSNINAIDIKNQIITNKMKILDKSQCLNIFGKGLKKKVIGYKTVWKYGWKQKYGWVLRPIVRGGRVHFSQWEYVKAYHPVWGKWKTKVPIYKYYYINDEALTRAKIKKTKK